VFSFTISGLCERKRHMKTKSNLSGYVIRSAAAVLLFLCALVALASAINLPSHLPKFPVPQNNTTFGANGHDSAASALAIRRDRTLTFADRVAYQRVIEEVYWQHRIWPEANAGSKPPLDKVMPQADIEKKVEDYLRNSQALEDYWQRPITPDQLQAEMERIANHTKQPGMLREIFAALGNDPFVIAECLARPVLTERLLTELYAHDQRFHGELKQRAEAELRTHRGVRRMNQTSGMYTEMKLVRSDNNREADSASSDANNAGAIRLNGSEWQESVEKLAREFGNDHPVAAGVPPAQPTRLPPQELLAQIKTGVLSPLREDEGHYYAVAVMNKGRDRLKLATVAWPKEPLRSWLARAETQVPITMAAVSSANYTLPVISTPSDGCSADTWTATSTTGVPGGRAYHTAVWTGSEMIVWGGVGAGTLAFRDYTIYVDTGGRYNPSTDSWTATSTTGAPDPRAYHTAVWTGSEMIVWGGYSDDSASGGSNSTLFNTGGRYNPSTDSWTATSTTNAPSAREFHTAVWTGTQMIVWGGTPDGISYLNTGGRYSPSTNTWTATSTTNAPDARVDHTAVWTGSEMIVWGGGKNYRADDNFMNTGGRYKPSTDSWIATSITGAPARRAVHTAVWTGSQMIVWGGLNYFDGNRDNFDYLNTGGRYCAGVVIQVTVQTTPAGLVFNVDGIDYSGTQTFTWATGSSHTIATSTPQNGAPGVRYYFSSWSDGGAISHSVAPTNNKTYTAKFGTQYYLTMNAGTGGKVSPYSSWRTSGTNVSISATPSAGYSFSKWTGSGAGSFSGTTNPVSITMNGPIKETATFMMVTVQTSPGGLSIIVDGQTYTAPKSFNWSPGSSHTIATTTPQSGAPGVRYYFSSWSDGGAISHTVTPTSTTTYTAKFGTQYYMTMSAGTGGHVSPGSSWRTSGSTFSISATPSTGYSFGNWTGSGAGSYSGPDNPRSITIMGPISEAANFTHN
jgi:hypothetical protein